MSILKEERFIRKHLGYKLSELTNLKEKIWNSKILSKIVLSENFIEKYFDIFSDTSLLYILVYQKLSEDFIERYLDKLNIDYITSFQILSDYFMEKRKDKLSFDLLIKKQKLSEEFLVNNMEEIDLYLVSEYQIVSNDFFNEYFNNQQKTQYSKIHYSPVCTTYIKNYAKKHKLKIGKKYLYAYIDLDKYGNLMYDYSLVKAKKRIYYTSWRCDLDYSVENSFGLGIFPEGNIKVRVKIEDFGVEVNREDGKARVWGFEIV